MNSIFSNIYDDLFDKYGLIPYLFPRTTRKEAVTEYLKNIISEYSSAAKVRSDAKYFLLVNFDQMVLSPLFQRMGYRRTSGLRLMPAVEEILSNIRRDISTIIAESRKAAFESDENEISGHTIMKTIDRIWQDLYSTKYQIWG